MNFALLVLAAVNTQWGVQIPWWFWVLSILSGMAHAYNRGQIDKKLDRALDALERISRK